MTKRTVSLLLALAMLVLPSCEGEREPIVAQSFALDTAVSVTLYGGTKEDAEEALRLVDRLDALLDRNDPNSEVSQLNASDGGSVSGELEEIIDASCFLCRAAGGEPVSLQSDGQSGAFDFTIGRLTELWDFKTATEPPSDEAIADALEHSGYGSTDGVLVQERVDIRLGGTQLDFGGVAKGYIGDKVAELLRSKGIARALINLGGNITTVCGEGQESFKIGIQDPFGDGGETIGYVEVGECTVSTSGVYQRYFEYDGVRYHHILDPRTGRPADSGIVSATVIADDGATADALATACVVLGEQDAFTLPEKLAELSCEEIGDIYIILVRQDGTLAFSSGAEDIFTPTK